MRAAREPDPGGRHYAGSPEPNGINCESLAPTPHLEFESAASRTLSARSAGKDFVVTCLRLSCRILAPLILVAGLTIGTALCQVLTKPQVANVIGKVENGVDQFRDYLKRRGDNAQANASAAPSDQKGQARRSRRGAATESQKATVPAKKDELDDALDALNRSTNRLRRKFDATDTWMETKVQVQPVLDDARRINQAVARGNYGSEVARLWAALRTGVNDLARAYGLQPLAV